jgi:dihydrofolate reductase
MARLRLRLSMSLDGFIAGPSQDLQNPLGIGGQQVHHWVFSLKAFREQHGMEGGEVNESTPIVANQFENVGATVMGRNMFGPIRGPWESAAPWNGWWGEDPPYHHPVFVLTHHARSPLTMQGGTTFHFVTSGPEAALEQALRAAGGKDVSIGGGAGTARHFLSKGLVDDMILSVSAVLLGSGERLFENTGTALHGLKLTRTVAAPGVAHLCFAR